MICQSNRLFAAFVVLAVLSGVAVPDDARAAQSYDNCTGFIDTIPTTITTQGVWCLRKDLSTNITSGIAVTLAANNVTLDCNGFKIGGLAAGNSSAAWGIWVPGRQNATVRHCQVRGFATGIRIDDGAGHLIEDNRLDNNLQFGIRVISDNTRIRRNMVYDTGGKVGSSYTWGISGTADITDNTVSGLFADSPGGELLGIAVNSQRPNGGSLVQGNIISGFSMSAAQGGTVFRAYGIDGAGLGRVRFSSNQVIGDRDPAFSISGFGIIADSSSYCLDNSIGGFTGNILNCLQSGNLTSP